jgi:hypothetical protein
MNSLDGLSEWINEMRRLYLLAGDFAPFGVHGLVAGGVAPSAPLRKKNSRNSVRRCSPARIDLAFR